MKKITINNALEVLCIIILLGVILFIISFYNKIPTIIPIHYDLYDKVDGVGSKSNVWIILAIGIITYIGMSFLQKYPQKFNYPVQVTESNKNKLFSLGIRIILIMKLCIILLYSYITLCMIGLMDLNSIILLPSLILFAVILPLIFIVKMKKV